MPIPTPLFTLSVYLEEGQVKSIHTFRDPASAQHRRLISQLLRRALASLAPEIEPSLVAFVDATHSRN